MADELSPPIRSLDELRAEIDRIDTELHRLLIARGEIIGELIAVKKTAESGSAFRPAREAAMLRRIAERHHGILPLDTVESIWRVIISTFTYVQAPYAVHLGTDAPEMRDVARFHFGFTVPLSVHESAAAAIAAVAAAKGDLGLIHAGSHNEQPWWELLAEPAAPKIIARLPFVERIDHPAGRQSFLVARAVSDAAATDRLVYGVRSTGRHGSGDDLETRLEGRGLTLIDAIERPSGTALLVAAAGTATEAETAAALGVVLCEDCRLDLVGSHAAPFRYTEPQKST